MNAGPIPQRNRLAPVPRYRYAAEKVHQYRPGEQPSRCPGCDYDLRMTPDRCPECGTVFVCIDRRRAKWPPPPPPLRNSDALPRAPVRSGPAPVCPQPAPDPDQVDAVESRRRREVRSELAAAAGKGALIVLGLVLLAVFASALR